MAQRRRSFNFLDLHDETFEELTFLLGHLDEPELVRPADPDQGLDGVVLGARGAPAPRGFQAKHFTRGISWPQCRKSLDDAVANYDVRHVTFTFPRDLTGPQIKKFEIELQSRRPSVCIDFWGASQLTARLLTPDGSVIARHIFGDDEFERLSRLILAGQELDTTGQAIAAMGAIGDRFSDDPYFEYSVGTRPASGSGDRPAAGTVVRVELFDEHGVHHIDALATPAAIAADRLPKGAMHVAGEDAIKRFQEFLRVGGEVDLPVVGFTWEQAPKYLDGLLGDTEEGRVRLTAPRREPRPLRIELDTTAAQYTFDVDMQATVPRSDWDYATQGSCGGAELDLQLRVAGEVASSV